MLLIAGLSGGYQSGSGSQTHVLGTVSCVHWSPLGKLSDRQPVASLPGKSVASTIAGLPQVALVQWTESVGLTLVSRDLTSMQLRTPGGQILTFCVLQVFPFTSEGKRMGIIVRVGARPAVTGAEGHELTTAELLRGALSSL